MLKALRSWHFKPYLEQQQVFQKEPEFYLQQLLQLQEIS